MMTWVLRRKLCNLFGALFSLLLVFPTMYMVIDRQLPMVLTIVKFQPHEVKPGESVTVTWSATEIRKFGDGVLDCKGTFVRRIVDAGGFIIETKPLPVEKIGDPKDNHLFVREISIPTLLPGLATYQVTTSYWCNPIQKIFPMVHREEAAHFIVRPLPPA